MGADGTTTIKYAESNKDYDAPWNVFVGSVAERRADLIEAFGWDEAEVAGQTLSQLTVKASAQAKAEYKLRNDLGAAVISVNTTDSAPAQPAEQASAPAQAADQPTGADAWAQVAEQPEAPELTLLDKVLAATTKRQVRLLWRDNKDDWPPIADQAKAHAATLPED